MNFVTEKLNLKFVMAMNLDTTLDHGSAYKKKKKTNDKND